MLIIKYEPDQSWLGFGPHQLTLQTLVFRGIICSWQGVKQIDLPGNRKTSGPFPPRIVSTIGVSDLHTG